MDAAVAERCARNFKTWSEPIRENRRRGHPMIFFDGADYWRKAPVYDQTGGTVGDIPEIAVILKFLQCLADESGNSIRMARTFALEGAARPKSNRIT
jgi:hypothetical protein